MSTLYVANCSARQHFDLLYRLPEQSMGSPPRSRMIGPMSITRIDGLNEPEMRVIEEQLTRYGAREAGERIAGTMKVERIFSRSPIREERVRQVLAFNVGLMNLEGRKRLDELGVAASQRTEEVMLDMGVQGNLTKMHLSVQEDSDSPELALGALVERTNDQKARSAHTQRNRRRKA